MQPKVNVSDSGTSLKQLGTSAEGLAAIRDVPKGFQGFQETFL